MKLHFDVCMSSSIFLRSHLGRFVTKPYRGSFPNASFGSGKKFNQPNFALANYVFGLCIFWAKLFHYCGFFYISLQRVPALRAFWDLEKTVLHEMRVSGTVVSNAKIPHLHVDKPKTEVVETVLVIFV